MKLSQYIEAHHRDWGAALFVLPILVIPLALVGLCECFVWLLH